MAKYQEVEAKFRLYNIDYVLKRLSEIGSTKTITDEVQKDSYFVPYHRNFLENEIVSEWLRIRETSNGSSLNYKQWLPIGARIQNTCNEYETAIADVYALRKILMVLDFHEIVVVNKTRNSWLYCGIEISIDYVDALGYFIELEATDTVEDEFNDLMQNSFAKILNLINAETGERDRRGYPYQLLEKKMEG